jgi:SAM-dependent methyltransferase
VKDAHGDANRANWDERADLHAVDRSGFYAIEALVAGADALSTIEAAEIGDVAGLKIAHFQCHIGTDTLSLARRGAVVTGLDFSPRAIAQARGLASRTGLAATFVDGRVSDAPALIGGGFDLVFTSWGTVTWLDDLSTWAMAIAGVLRVGGRLYFADGHPTMAVFEEEGGIIRPRYDWRTPRERPLALDFTATYTGDSTPVRASRTYEWNHPLSDIVGVLLSAGLRLDFLHEHEKVPWRMFPSMVRAEGSRMFRLPDGAPRMPLAVSLGATKVATRKGEVGA